MDCSVRRRRAPGRGGIGIVNQGARGSLHFSVLIPLWVNRESRTFLARFCLLGMVSDIQMIKNDWICLSTNVMTEEIISPKIDKQIGALCDGYVYPDLIWHN